MLSFRARLVKFLLMNRHLLKFQIRKELVDWNKYESVLNFRDQVETGAGKFGKLPEDIRISPVNILPFDTWSKQKACNSLEIKGYRLLWSCQKVNNVIEFLLLYKFFSFVLGLQFRSPCGIQMLHAKHR